MRTNIVIDDQLMAAAMQATGLRTKKAVVEAGLRLLIGLQAQSGVRRLRGKVDWQDDLDELRTSRAGHPAGEVEVCGVTIGGVELATSAALNYRTLRARGFTIRRTLDCLIATFCLTNQHALLHSDRDFDPFERELGLQVVHPAP